MYSITTFKYISSCCLSSDHEETYFVTLGVKGILERDHVRMVEVLHYLELAILIALVLVDLLDGDLVSGLVLCGLKDDPEGAIANNSFSVICKACLQ